jgi:Tfp pilus assembly protein PilV
MKLITLRLRTARAITLIEVLIAFAVFTVGVLSLLSIYSLVFSYIGERDDEMQAVAFGQQYMESVRNQFAFGTATDSATPAPTTAPVDAGYAIAFGVMRYNEASPAPTIAPSANFTASVIAVSTPQPSTYDVTIKVTWPGPQGHAAVQFVTLESMITKQVP